MQPDNEQSPTAHIQPATVKFRFKPISVLHVTKVIKKLVNSKLQEFMVSLTEHLKNVLRT